jgi:hypothetical protein
MVHNLIPPNSWGLSTTTLVKENVRGGFALDGIKIGGIQVTNWGRVADARPSRHHGRMSSFHGGAEGGCGK